MSGATTPQFIREVVIFYAEGGEVFWVHWASRIVREALVALVRLVLVRCEIALSGRKGRRYRQVVEPVGFHFEVYIVSR